MERIASFTINHLILQPGLYLSRLDGDVETYDIRMRRPNGGDYLSQPVLHTIEHLFATYVRNSADSDRIIYFGPMGCRTGFYFLTRGLSGERVISLTREAFQFIRDYEGVIPGATAKECGNYLEHDLAGAKAEAAGFLAVLQDYTPAGFRYPEI